MKNVDMKECFKKHPMLHLLAGLGVGLILIALVPSLVSNALMLGVVAVVAAIGLEYVLGQN